MDRIECTSIGQSIKSNATLNYLECASTMDTDRAPQYRDTELITQLTRWYERIDYTHHTHTRARTQKKTVDTQRDSEWERTSKNFGGIHIKWVRWKPSEQESEKMQAKKKYIACFLFCRPKNNNSSAYTLTMPRFMFAIFSHFFLWFSVTVPAAIFVVLSNTYPPLAHCRSNGRSVGRSSVVCSAAQFIWKTTLACTPNPKM